MRKFALILMLLSSMVQAETPAERGLAIINEVDRRNQGWQDSNGDMEMILRNRQGKESRRTLHVSLLEVIGDGDKSLAIFDSPRDIKGTAFLSYSHALTPDEQWLYLSALKRVKRISSRNKSGPFVGSEFAYEDLSSFEVEKYSYIYLRDEELKGLDCYLLELKPEYEYSGYSKSFLWVDKAHYRLQKIEYYDRKGSLLKTQEFNDYRLYLDKYWRALTITMDNHQNGKSTILKLKNYQFKTGLTDNDFTKHNLKHQH